MHASFTSTWKLWVPLHCTYFTLHSHCVLGREFKVNNIREMIRLQFCFVLLNTLFLRTCNSTRPKVTWENSFICYSCWPICFKIYNHSAHSVSPESKKCSKHELKTRSSAWTKCRHTAETNIEKYRLLQFHTVLSTTIFTPVFTVGDKRKWLFGVLFTCIVFVFNLSTVAKCMNVLYSLRDRSFITPLGYGGAGGCI